ncbi:MFS transporter, DHA2 family, multidrug resistance protein [bacterium A37T11]|nr:MFS transporter, DHA2 family, multidrug resistance protein [bacterium A37T11]
MQKKLLIVTVILAAIMELIDTSIVNVALSYMSGNLGSTLEDTSWVVTSYAIANVIIIPMTSFLTAKLGRRNYYIGSILLFTFCSLMCGQANSIWMLVAFRFFQGIGGGALLSVSQAVVFEVFPKEKQGIASALFGIGVFIGPTIGPTLGGYITENYSWPWIFYINVPIGILVAISCFILLTESSIKSLVRKVDWTGIVLLAVGISTLQTVLERGETEDWFDTPYIVWFSVISVVGLTLFVFWELTIDYPVVNLRVLKSKTLSIAAILTFITGVGMFTSIFLTPVIAQRLLGFSPTQSGLLLLPGAILAVIALVISGTALQKGTSPILIIVIGFLCFIYFNWRMSQMNFEVSAGYISVSLIFRGLGMALLTVPLTILAVSSLSPADIPQGSALNNMMRQLGGSFGISIINTYAFRHTAAHRNDLIGNVTSTNQVFSAQLNKNMHYFQQKGYSWMHAHNMALKSIDLRITKQATLMAYLDSFILIGLLFAAALPLLLLVIGSMKNKRPPEVILDH